MGKALRTALATVLLGGLLGYVATGLGGPLISEMALFGNRESTEARRYMIAVLENEPETLATLTPKGDVVSRAMQYLQSDESQGQWTPLSLTYMGGITKGGLQVHMYAIELRSASGREQFIPLALTLANGKVIRRE
jgi:hypothetical protein